MSNSTNQENN